MAVPAAITGLMEFATLQDANPAADIAVRHMLIMGCAVVVYVGALVVRGGPLTPEGWRLYTALSLSTVGLALLAAGGWYGGRMVYQYGVGGAEPPTT